MFCSTSIKKPLSRINNNQIKAINVQQDMLRVGENVLLLIHRWQKVL